MNVCIHYYNYFYYKFSLKMSQILQTLINPDRRLKFSVKHLNIDIPITFKFFWENFEKMIVYLIFIEINSFQAENRSFKISRPRIHWERKNSIFSILKKFKHTNFNDIYRNINTLRMCLERIILRKYQDYRAENLTHFKTKLIFNIATIFNYSIIIFKSLIY